MARDDNDLAGQGDNGVRKWLRSRSRVSNFRSCINGGFWRDLAFERDMPIDIEDARTLARPCSLISIA